jgi:DNA ligase (NAD+)
LECTTVARASLHNISIIEALELGIGDIIGVYKANMIIPQIAFNETKSNNIIIPSVCPVCNKKTEIRQNADVKNLVCVNIECPAKMIKSLSHFVSRDAMNIDGLSEATLEKFIQQGFISKSSDIYAIEQYKDQIVTMDSFGEKSYENLIKAIQISKKVSLANFIYALGISNVGLSNAKLLAKRFDFDLKALMEANADYLVTINTIGEVIAKSLVEYFKKEENRLEINKLEGILIFIKPSNSNDVAILQDKTFVITGSLNVYDNRKALQETIEGLGGKVASAVSSNTDYLINNDMLSNSSKNIKAKALGIQIIDEETFINMIKEI